MCDSLELLLFTCRYGENLTVVGQGGTGTANLHSFSFTSFTLFITSKVSACTIFVMEAPVNRGLPSGYTYRPRKD